MKIFFRTLIGKQYVISGYYIDWQLELRVLGRLNGSHSLCV